MAEAPPVTVEFLRQHCARLGLFPSDQELEALVPLVQALHDGARQVEDLLMLEQEPGTVFQLEGPSST